MSAEAMKVASVLDTSHLKVKFPFKAKYGNYINGKFVEPKSGKYLTLALSCLHLLIRDDHYPLYQSHQQ